MTTAASRGPYRILIVSPSDKFNTFALRLLSGERFETPDVVKSASTARRRLAEQNYDIVVINTPLSDEFGVEFALDVSSEYGSGIVLVLPNDIYDDVTERVIDSGVVTLQRPVSNLRVLNAVRLLCAMQEKFRSVERRALTLEEKMDEIRVVNRAKWLLIQNKMLSEDEAHKYIGKQAMDRCVSRRAVAEEIIKEYQDD